MTTGSTATFTIGSPSGSWSIQWQVSTDGGATWTADTTDGGSTTGTLTIADATAAQNGLQYRAAITDSAGTVDTPAATLTVRSSTAPVVSAITPNVGGPFSLVFIRGSNFSKATTVSFGGGHPALFLALSSSLIVALAPIERHVAVDVTVTTPQGTSATSSADRFTYR